jgi:hypothetical protein
MTLRLTFALILFSMVTATVQGQYALDVTETTSAAGSNTQVSVNIDNAAPVLGFSFGVTHDGAVLSPLGIDQGTATSLLNGGTGAEYFFSDLAPANGPGVILACITTFGGSLDSIPAGTGQQVAILNYTVSAGANPGTTTALTPVTTLGSPPTNIVFTVGGVSVFPTSTAGAVSISVPPPTAPSVSNADVCTCNALLSWTNGASYDSIEVRVGGVLVQTLAGNATSTNVTLPAVASSLCVRGVANGTASPEACITEGCPVFTPPPPLASLNCELTSNVPGTGCEYLLTWTGAGPYSAINISIDGVPVATLAGTATSSTGSLPFSLVGANFTVEAVDICGGSVNTLTCSLLCEEGPTFVRGDCNADGNNNIADVVAALSFLFGGGGSPLCGDACDLNDDGSFDISDPVFLLSNLFSNGNNPPAPYPNCGVDATDTDAIDCNDFPACP